MIKRSFVPPGFKKEAFNCPHCNVYAIHNWGKLDAKIDTLYHRLPDFMVSVCTHCREFSVWKNGAPVYPQATQIPSPNPDLPEKATVLYLEGRAVVSRSPRAAAALFRHCMKTMCIEICGHGGDMDAGIASLVELGLNTCIRDSLVQLRVIGDNAVEPGMIEDSDDFATAAKLSQIINIIADALISQPMMLEELNRKISTVRRNDESKPE